jgi:pantothenate kinase
VAADKTIRALCEDKFRDFHHGLKLIARDGEPRRFVISREVIDAPDKVLSRWVVDRFRESGDQAK